MSAEYKTFKEFIKTEDQAGEPDYWRLLFHDDSVKPEERLDTIKDEILALGYEGEVQEALAYLCLESIGKAVKLIDHKLMIEEKSIRDDYIGRWKVGRITEKEWEEGSTEDIREAYDRAKKDKFAEASFSIGFFVRVYRAL